MTDIESPDPAPSLKDISEILTDDKVRRCSCGSAAFFDCGIELASVIGSSPGDRYKDYASREHIKVCVDCRKPVLVWGGDLYDLSEYVSASQIEAHMAWRRGKSQGVEAVTEAPSISKRTG